MIRDAVIVGGGAAGLAAACALGGLDVVLLEKQPRVGRKLLATGNGRCNLTNLDAAPEHWHGDAAAAARTLALCPPGRVLRFFESLGVPARVDGEGRAYPMSGQAASVLDALRLSAAERGAELRTDSAVERVARGRGGFAVSVAGAGEPLRARTVLIAAGGLAAPKLGACGDGFRLLEALGHRSTRRSPALSPLRTAPGAVRALKGQRVECAVCLEVDGRAVRSERGEVLFGDDRLSGIASMQLARGAGEAFRAGRSVCAALDLMPDVKDARALLADRAARLPKRANEDLLTGIVPKRVGMELIKAAGLSLAAPAGGLSGPELGALARLMKRWRFPLTGVEGFEQAQVTAGGVELREFDPETMGSRRVPGLYAAGEVLNVDGDCGGYNLQWAWASALVAADAVRAYLADGK